MICTWAREGKKELRVVALCLVCRSALQNTSNLSLSLSLRPFPSNEVAERVRRLHHLASRESHSAFDSCHPFPPLSIHSVVFFSAGFAFYSTSCSPEYSGRTSHAFFQSIVPSVN